MGRHRALLAADRRASAAAGPDRRDRRAHVGVGHVRGRHRHAHGPAAAALPARHTASTHCRGRQAMNIHAVREQATLAPLQSEARRAAAIRTPLALTLGLLAFLLANAFLLNGLIWSVSPEPHRVTVLKHSWDVLRGEGGDDSWGAMQ